MDDTETIDPNTLDAHTLKQIKRVVESYPVVTTDTPYHDLNNYRRRKRDTYTTLAATIDEWLDENDS